MRWVLWFPVTACTATVSLSSLAQSSPAGTASGPTFAQVFDAAWQRSAAGQSAQARREQQRAARDAAGGLTPAPPSIALSQRSDRLNRNLGVRETEVELALPLWLPGTRAAALALAGAEGDATESQLQLSRLKLVGEVREAVWSVRFTHNEVDASTRRVAEAQALAADLQRRVSAGDLARTDANQAQGLVQLAAASLAEARGRLLRAERLYAALTGMALLPLQDEVPTPAPALENHPQIVNAERATAAARSRLDYATRTTRDPPELTFGVRSERASFGDSNATSARIGLRVPFGSDARNQPRITAASAELLEIEAGVRLERDRLLAEIDAAAADLEQARRIEQLAAERARSPPTPSSCWPKPSAWVRSTCPRVCAPRTNASTQNSRWAGRAWKRAAPSLVCNKPTDSCHEPADTTHHPRTPVHGCHRTGAARRVRAW